MRAAQRFRPLSAHSSRRASRGAEALVCIPVVRAAQRFPAGPRKTLRRARQLGPRRPRRHARRIRRRPARACRATIVPAVGLVVAPHAPRARQLSAQGRHDGWAMRPAAIRVAARTSVASRAPGRREAALARRARAAPHGGLLFAELSQPPQSRAASECRCKAETSPFMAEARRGAPTSASTRERVTGVVGASCPKGLRRTMRRPFPIGRALPRTTPRASPPNKARTALSGRPRRPYAGRGASAAAMQGARRCCGSAGRSCCSARRSSSASRRGSSPSRRTSPRGLPAAS